METKKVIINDKEIDFVIKIDEKLYDENNIKNMEDTIELPIEEIKKQESKNE